MRANEQNRKSTYSTTQLFHMNFKHSVEEDNYAILSLPISEYGVSLAEVKSLKKKLGRS